MLSFIDLYAGSIKRRRVYTQFRGSKVAYTQVVPYADVYARKLQTVEIAYML